MQVRIIVASALLAAALAGCGGSGASSPATPTQTVAPPPSVTATPVAPPPDATATPSAPAATDVPRARATAPTADSDAPTQAPPPPPPPAADTHVSLIAEGTRFLTASLTAPAGGVTIVLDNRDSGIAHDVKVFSGGANIGFTSPAAGPITQTLALGILAAGSYSFVCDVHPQAMHGVLTVGG